MPKKMNAVYSLMGLTLLYRYSASTPIGEESLHHRFTVHDEDRHHGIHTTPIPIIKNDFYRHHDGYHYAYETGNGIHVQESGYFKSDGTDKKHAIIVQHGSITYHDEHGRPISLTYVADENGFRPHGAHLPTPPPIPAALRKALHENKNVEGGDGDGDGDDDGSYHDDYQQYQSSYNDADAIDKQ